jgi:hypothetical protein
MIIEIPENVKTYELGSSIIWLDESGILYSVPKGDEPPPKRTNEEVRQDMDFLKKITGNKKVCLIIESNPNSAPPEKKERDFIAAQLDSITKAMAILTSSPLSRMIANLFFGFKPPPYPVKMFTDPAEAKEWIKQYL